jgi:hypothetical protein
MALMDEQRERMLAVPHYPNLSDGPMFPYSGARWVSDRPSPSWPRATSLWGNHPDKGQSGPILRYRETTSGRANEMLGGRVA